MTRRELLRTIHEERSRLESTLARVPAAQAAEVRTRVGHWESELLQRLGGAPPDAADSYHALMHRLVELSDDDLNSPPSYRPWQGEPLWRDVAAVTYEHYWEHTEPLRLRLARAARSRKPDRLRSPSRRP
jgi:hypothetical protein